jgi:hypothetical protein
MFIDRDLFLLKFFSLGEDVGGVYSTVYVCESNKNDPVSSEGCYVTPPPPPGRTFRQEINWHWGSQAALPGPRDAGRAKTLIVPAGGQGNFSYWLLGACPVLHPSPPPRRYTPPPQRENTTRRLVCGRP